MRFKRSDVERVTENTAVSALLSEGALQKREKRKRERREGWVTSILTSGCSPVRRRLSAGMRDSPFQNTTQARLQLQCLQPVLPRQALPEGNF